MILLLKVAMYNIIGFKSKNMHKKPVCLLVPISMLHVINYHMITSCKWNGTFRCDGITKHRLCYKVLFYSWSSNALFFLWTASFLKTKLSIEGIRHSKMMRFCLTSEIWKICLKLQDDTPKRRRKRVSSYKWIQYNNQILRDWRTELPQYISMHPMDLIRAGTSTQKLFILNNLQHWIFLFYLLLFKTDIIRQQTFNLFSKFTYIDLLSWLRQKSYYDFLEVREPFIRPAYINGICWCMINITSVYLVAATINILTVHILKRKRY